MITPSTRQGAATAVSAKSRNCGLGKEQQLRSRHGAASAVWPRSTPRAKKNCDPPTRSPMLSKCVASSVSISIPVLFCIYFYVYLQLRCNMRGSAATAPAARVRPFPCSRKHTRHCRLWHLSFSPYIASTAAAASATASAAATASFLFKVRFS